MFRLIFATASILALSVTHIVADNEKQLLEIHQGSFISFTCEGCEVPLEGEETIALEAGSQIFHVRQIDEEKKIYRTENWLGGSPVSFIHVNTLPEPMDLASLNDGDIIEKIVPPLLDDTAVASTDPDEDALDMIEEVINASLVPENLEETKPVFEPSNFELRLN